LKEKKRRKQKHKGGKEEGTRIIGKWKMDEEKHHNLYKETVKTETSMRAFLSLSLSLSTSA
jgi:hypothetical protein